MKSIRDYITNESSSSDQYVIWAVEGEYPNTKRTNAFIVTSSLSIQDIANKIFNDSSLGKQCKHYFRSIVSAGMSSSSNLKAQKEGYTDEFKKFLKEHNIDADKAYVNFQMLKYYVRNFPAPKESVDFEF